MTQAWPWILLYVGGKLLLQPWLRIPAGWSLAVVAAVLGVSIAASQIPVKKSGKP